ncbi:MAG: cyclophilin-like family protein [Saprospiraceae bacterium]
MTGKLITAIGELTIKWDESCQILPTIKAHPSLKGVANHIQGEVFFYQYELDIPFNGQEKEVFERGDVVYWRSATDKTKFGILLMYGQTIVGDDTQIRTTSAGIKIGEVIENDKIELIATRSELKLV